MKTFNIKFYEHRKLFLGISIAVLLLGVIFNVIFGTELDIQFTGGAVIKYAYTGDIDQEDITQLAIESTGKSSVTVNINEDVITESGEARENNVTLSFGGTDALELSQQQQLYTALTQAYPDAEFEIVSSNSVNPTMGRDFFLKCMVAVAIAAVLLVFYISLRFRKIGGASAGVMAIIALIHDVLLVYFTFVIFRIPLNDNFIAVVLTILGYSLNNTIVIYDRIRENRRLLGAKAELSDLVNASINQTLTRSVYVTFATFAAVAVVYIVGVIYDLSTIQTFALPMMVGIVVGCYSSVCLAGPLYVMWQNAKAKRKAAKSKK